MSRTHSVPFTINNERVGTAVVVERDDLPRTIPIPPESPLIQ
jgi:hypothetical protein